MATLIAAGQSASVTLAAGQYIIATGIGTAQAAALAGRSAPKLHVINGATGVTVGPVAINRTLLVIADPAGPGISYIVKNTADGPATLSAADLARGAVAAGLGPEQALGGGFVAPASKVNASTRLIGTLGGNLIANLSFVQQFQALAPYVGWRPYFCNYDTSGPLTGVLCKGAGAPTDLNDGAALAWASANPPASIPAAPLFTDSTQCAPTIVAGPTVIQSSVARTDFPAEAPLLQLRTYFPNAGKIAAAPGNAASEILTRFGYRYGSNNASGDLVTTTTTPMVPGRGAGQTQQPVFAVEFFYNQPVRVLADSEDSLGRGQNSADPAVGFGGTMQRVCALKNARNTGVLWSPLPCSVSGRQHTPSYLTAMQIATVLKPDFLMFRPWTVNDLTLTAAKFDQSWMEAQLVVEACRQNGVRPVIFTTGGLYSYDVSAQGLLSGLNARLRTLRNAGAIVLDVAALLFDTNLKLLPQYDDGNHTHWNDAGYDVLAQALDPLIS